MKLQINARRNAFAPIFAWLHAVMLVFGMGFSDHAIAVESSSTCWVYNGVTGVRLLDADTAQALQAGAWASPESALDAFAKAATDRWIGASCFARSGQGTVAQVEKGAVYADKVTSGPIGDPRTGISFGYAQTVAFLNEFGEYCSFGLFTLGGEFHTVDGKHLNFPQCRQTHIVRLSPRDTAAESEATLASVDPGKSIALLARVYDQNDQPVPNVALELKLEALPQSGGHQHGDDTSALRTGTLSSNAPGTAVSDGGKVLSGNSGSEGLVFEYQASQASGDITIKARCTDGKNCTQDGPDTVWVGVKGLVPIPSVPAGLPFATYELLESDGSPVGRTDRHLDNHYLTPEAIFKLWNLGFRYSMVEFPDNPLLHVNDASLERGGVFDLKRNWKPPHHEHQRGTVVDIRANLRHGAIPESAFERFEQIADNLGIDAKKHIDLDTATGEEIVSTRHFHVRLLGRKE